VKDDDTEVVLGERHAREFWLKSRG